MDTKIVSATVELVIVVQSDDPAFSDVAAHKSADEHIAVSRPGESWEYDGAELTNYDEWECHYRKAD